jgi:hypothetical protein
MGAPTPPAVESMGDVASVPLVIDYFALMLAPEFRSFLAVGLQFGRVFPQMINLVLAIHAGDRTAMRRASRAIASAILDGARDRSREAIVRTRIDQQRRTEPLQRLRKSRPGRGPQVVARRRARAAARLDRVGV